LYRVLKVIPVKNKGPADFITRYRSYINSGKNIFKQGRSNFFVPFLFADNVVYICYLGSGNEQRDAAF
jgi:hypothetical protein